MDLTHVQHAGTHAEPQKYCLNSERIAPLITTMACPLLELRDARHFIGVSDSQRCYGNFFGISHLHCLTVFQYKFSHRCSNYEFSQINPLHLNNISPRLLANKRRQRLGLLSKPQPHSSMLCTSKSNPHNTQLPILTILATMSPQRHPNHALRLNRLPLPLCPLLANPVPNTRMPQPEQHLHGRGRADGCELLYWILPEVEPGPANLTPR